MIRFWIKICRQTASDIIYSRKIRIIPGGFPIMTHIKLFPAIAASLFLISCDQSLPKSDRAASGTYAPVVQGSGPVPVLSPVSAPVPAGVAATTAGPATASAAVSSGSGLNPAHGMPGHRCDIAVGAPLSSNLSKQNSAAAVAQPAVAPVQVTPSISGLNKLTAGATGGLNPKHGEPGHRCDIAVGAPLNSPSAANSANSISTTPNASNPLPVSTQPVTPIVLNPIQGSANTNAVSAANGTGTATATGLNPKHGEPGHRCDIAVGAPLNSKPNQ